MHEVLVNRLGGLSLPRKSVVRLTDRPDMTLDVYRGRKTTIQQYKKDARNLPNNYRPISLLSVLGKTMERAVHKQVYNYCVSNNVFTPHQSGFIKGDSTTYQLLHLYKSFCEAVDSGKEVRVIFSYISKAFGRVWHMGLIHKLQGIGLSGEILDWF